MEEKSGSKPVEERPTNYRRRFVRFEGFDNETQLEIYLANLRETGAYTCAAESVGCNPQEIISYRRDNPEFQALCDDALAAHGQMFVRAARQRAIEGYENPIIGGRNRDEIVGYERKYSDSLMAMFLKKVDPAGFKDRSEVKVEANVNATFDYSSYSQRARDLMRKLAEVIKEDNEARARGEEIV